MTDSNNDIDQFEHLIEKKLRKDFPREIEALEEALECLAICVRPKLLGKPESVKSLLSQDYSTIDNNSLSLFGSVVLLNEALVRLEAARRLFLSGYPSRALASTRDALESMMVGDILRIDGRKVKDWIKGKQIKVTSQYEYHRILNWDIWTNAQAIMNPLGTHSYMEATFLSSIPQLSILFPNEDEFQRMYQHDMLFTLWRMLIRCLQMLWYIKSVFPEVKPQVPGLDDTVNKVKLACEKQLQISLDEYLIIKKSGGEPETGDT